MGFRSDGFATVWSVTDKGNYSVANITVSKKNKETGVYDIEFKDGFVRLVGTAHEKFKGRVIPESKGELIKITSCDVTNFYKKPDGEVSYAPHYTIFGFDFYDEIRNNGTEKQKQNKVKNEPKAEDFMNVPDDTDDEELPFI